MSRTNDLGRDEISRLVIRLAIPTMLAQLVNVLYSIVDRMYIGTGVGDLALAGVGICAPIVTLLASFGSMVGQGGAPIMAMKMGSGNEKEARQVLNNGFLMLLILSAVLTSGFLLSKNTLLMWFGASDATFSYANTYVTIYTAGTFFALISGGMNSFLIAQGFSGLGMATVVIGAILNILLDPLFIFVFHMGVAGAAIATVISQVISAGLVAICLMKTNASYRLELHKLHIYKDKFFGMMRVGLPAGMQGAVFSISNVLIQSSINSFGSTVMAGSTAAANIEGFVYTAMNAFYQTALSFTGQNMGAKKYDRVAKILRICILCVTVTGVVLGCGAYLLGTPLLSIYTSDPEVIQYGLERMLIVCVPYFLCGIMDTHVGVLRGMGYSIMPMIVSLTGACALRVVWILTVFQMNRTLFILFLSYPVTWAVTAAAHFVCYLIVHHKMTEKAKAEQAEAAKA